MSRPNKSYNVQLSDHIEIHFNHYILMVFLSAIIVAPDLWLSFLARLNPEDQRNKTCLSVFACLAGACFIFTIVRAYGFLHVCLKCAERLHDKMVVAAMQMLFVIFAQILVTAATNVWHCKLLYVVYPQWLL